MRAETYSHELLPHKVSDVINIGWKRVTTFFRSVFRGRLVSTTYRLVQHILGGVLAGQTEVYEIINRRSLSPGVSLRCTLEIPIAIDVDWAEPIRIHSRRAAHDVVGRAITARRFRLETSSI